MKKSVRYIAIAAVVAVIAAGLLIYWPFSTTVVLVVRHAERDDSPTATQCTAPNNCAIPAGQPNPPLLAPPVGQISRAEVLAHVVEDTGIQAIYASCFCRTQLTVQPTATHYGGLPITQVSQMSDADITNLVELINTNNVGQKVLVAGHSDTVDKIIRELGGGTIDPILPGEFDNLYVVTITRGWWWWRWFGYGRRVRVVRLKYGAPT